MNFYKWEDNLNDDIQNVIITLTHTPVINSWNMDIIGGFLGYQKNVRVNWLHKNWRDDFFLKWKNPARKTKRVREGDRD
jgi:nucleoside-specific outer membrane channel protein Tsx